MEFPRNHKRLLLSSVGFTLIELLLVISIISLLTSIVLGTLKEARAKSRDTKRIQEIIQIRTALELYRAAIGTYPIHTNEAGCNTWDCSTMPASPGIPAFLTQLQAPQAYLPQNPKDPINSDSPPTMRYEYRRDASCTLWGCDATRPCYLLRVTTLESANRPGPQFCPSAPATGWIIGGYE